MQQDLLEILVDIFKSSGYSVTISSHCDILVEKNRHQAYVRCALNPDYEELKSFSEIIEGCTGIYVMVQKTSEELINYAAELGIHIWDRDELAFQIGRAFLLNMEQKAKDLNCEPEIPSKNKSLDTLKEQTFESNAESWKAEETFKQKPYSSGRLELPHQSQSPRGEKTSFEAKTLLNNHKKRENLGESGQVEIQKINSYETLNIQSVEPKISKDQAIIIAKPYLSNPKDAILKFVPFWKYKYSIDVEKRFRSRVLSIAGKGSGLLNALNKSREEMKIDDFGAPTRIPSVQYELKKPNVDKKNAEKFLLDLIIEENTREMRFNNMEGQAIIYEHRSISPKREEIELDMELVYVPVWEVKGKRNSLEINAYNAKVLEHPIDEDAEFL